MGGLAQAPACMSRILSTAVLSVTVAACGAGGGGDDDPGNGPDAGVTGDACVGPSCVPVDAPPPAATFTFLDVQGVPNLDDDDGAGGRDWEQAPFATDDDLATLRLPADRLALAGGDVQLTLSGDSTFVRVYRGTQLLLGGTAGTGPATLSPDGTDIELQVEFGQFLATAQLALAGGGEATTVKLQAAPLIMNHHLQPAEHLWAVSVNGNADMLGVYASVFGSRFTSVSGASVSSDVWIQDEFEFATTTGVGTQRLDVVIDSIRDRGLDNYGGTFVTPDSTTGTWGNPNLATTYDSFGNLEASPPVTVNGTSYPFGRIYYGKTNTVGMSSTLGNFLAAQKVQLPFTIPTSWLCVGHVDEFSSFVPDPSSPKGFKLVMADVPSALALLQGLPASTSIPLYGQDHGYATTGSILADTALVALNNDIQADYLDPITAKFKTELGLTDADIIKIPSLFEQVGGCNGRVAALIPGMVNLIVANTDGATTHLMTADPFFRSVVSQTNDPVINAFRAAMPAGMQLHFVDDWDVYHLGLGEVHCGTNVRRTPTGSWWTSAAHLMGSN